jgi:hypothetical protein
LRKIAFILTFTVLSAGCAVNRKQARTASSSSTAAQLINLYESILIQNLTSRSFYIERAEIRIKSSEGEKSGLGTVKFMIPDKFLISIKSIGGIEVARIFLTGDSIMINDRFNKRLYYGSESYLKNKYGVTTSLLPVLLGDYVNEQKLDSNKISCTDGKLSVIGKVNSVKIKYLIDCELGKSVMAMPEGKNEENSLEIRYNEFFRVNNINFPGKIDIIEKLNNTTIEIKIQKIITPWEGVIEFIPGKQYEKILLL